MAGSSGNANPGPPSAASFLTLWHPRQTIGDGHDRHQTAVETFRSLPLDTPTQLTLFQA